MLMDAFIGEIKVFPYSRPVPVGWLLCDGKEYQAANFMTLFSVIGNIYGGDGKQTFRVPNLSGRTPIGASNNTPLSKAGGTESVSLTDLAMPAHKHSFVCGLAKDSSLLISQPVTGCYLSTGYSKSLGKGVFLYSNYKKDQITLTSQTLSRVGASTPHENRMPYLAMPYCICYQSDYYPEKP